MAAPTIVDSAFTYEASAGTSTSVTAPATVNAGDLLVFLVGSDSFRTAFDITGFPSGFTPLVYTGDNDNDVHSAICYKIADGTEDGATLTATAANSHNMWCGILRITGHDPDFPFGSRASNATGGTSGTVHTFDGLVSSRDDALCLLMVTSEATNASTPTVSTGAGTWTLLNDDNGGSVGGSVWTIEKTTAGDHGSFTVTFPANNRYAGHVVEIMAQPAGTITTSNHASVSATTGSPRIYSGVSIGGSPHTVYVFPEDGSITFSAGVTADYVIVPGGGSGGDNAFFGGGGGAGGLPVSASAQSLSAGAYSITVGDGGAGGGTATVNGNTGGNSSFNSTTAYGGGYGGGNAAGETTQGNGGGAGGANSGGTSTGSGFAGGAGSTAGDRGGGGGGGANGAGEAADGTNGGGNGGAGISSEILGLTTYFGGGGGGSASAGGEFSRGGKGGLGGGGWGGSGGQQRPTSGADGLGGGGGGDCQQGTGASLYDKGGDGVVIIALPESSASTITSSGAVTTGATTVSGTGTVVSTITGSGAVSTGATTVAGSGAVVSTITGSGDVGIPAATVDGSGVAFTTITEVGGGGEITFVGASSYASSSSPPGGQLALDFSGVTGLADGDYIIASVVQDPSANNDFGTVEAGWTKIAAVYANDTYDADMEVFAKHWSTGDATTVTFSGLASRRAIGHAYVLRGVDQSTPLDVAVTTAAPGSPSTGAANPPAITPVTPGAQVIAIGCAGVQSPSSNFVAAELSNFATGRSGNIVHGIGMMPEWDGVSAVDPVVWTGPTVTFNHLSSWAAVTVALRPASGAGGAEVSIGATTVSGSGTVVSTITSSGAVTTGATTVDGSGVVNTTVTGSGDVQPGAVTVAGSGTVTADNAVSGSGNATTGAVEVSGTGTVVSTITGSGAVTTGAVTVSGAAPDTNPIQPGGFLPLKYVSKSGKVYDSVDAALAEAGEKVVQKAPKRKRKALREEIREIREAVRTNDAPPTLPRERLDRLMAELARIDAEIAEVMRLRMEMAAQMRDDEEAAALLLLI